MNYVTSELLAETGVTHGFGTAGFSLGDYLSSMDIKGARYFQTNQLHSDEIAILSTERVIPEAVIGDLTHTIEKGGCPLTTAGMAGARLTSLLEADAFMTAEQGVVCYIRTADCVPILLHDIDRGVIAAVHAGWRGTSLRIAAKVVDKFVSEFGSVRENIVAAIGPAIGGSCYEVGDDVLNVFEKEGLAVLAGGDGAGRSLLDLKSINHTILKESGLVNIDNINICNHCDTRFASYRRDNTETFRQVNFILLK